MVSVWDGGGSSAVGISPVFVSPAPYHHLSLSVLIDTVANS